MSFFKNRAKTSKSKTPFYPVAFYTKNYIKEVDNSHKHNPISFIFQNTIPKYRHPAILNLRTFKTTLHPETSNKAAMHREDLGREDTVVVAHAPREFYYIRCALAREAQV